MGNANISIVDLDIRQTLLYTVYLYKFLSSIYIKQEIIVAVVVLNIESIGMPNIMTFL